MPTIYLNGVLWKAGIHNFPTHTINFTVALLFFCLIVNNVWKILSVNHVVSPIWLWGLHIFVIFFIKIWCFKTAHFITKDYQILKKSSILMIKKRNMQLESHKYIWLVCIEKLEFSAFQHTPDMLCCPVNFLFDMLMVCSNSSETASR